MKKKMDIGILLVLYQLASLVYSSKFTVIKPAPNWRQFRAVLRVDIHQNKMLNVILKCFL